MTSADHDVAGAVVPAGDGQALWHIGWQWWAAVSATLMDVFEMTALGQLRVLVDRYLTRDAGEAHDESHSHNQG